jgi:hypothetical protein
LNYFGKTKEEEKKPIFKTFTRWDLLPYG